jgi:hypothetical protein
LARSAERTGVSVDVADGEVDWRGKGTDNFAGMVK